MKNGDVPCLMGQSVWGFLLPHSWENYEMSRSTLECDNPSKYLWGRARFFAHIPEGDWWYDTHFWDEWHLSPVHIEYLLLTSQSFGPVLHMTVECYSTHGIYLHLKSQSLTLIWVLLNRSLLSSYVEDVGEPQTGHHKELRTSTKWCACHQQYVFFP